MFKALQRLQSYFAKAGKTANQKPPEPDYRVYTKEFDVVTNARKLDSILGRLKPEAEAQQERAWETFEYSLQEWRTRSTLNALEATARIRRAKDPETLRATAITILVDHSGSMKGQSILLAAAACDIAQDFLHHLGITTEILGFTTVEWKGGKSRRQWHSKGRTPLPGRLTDLLHIIYNSALDTNPSAGGRRVRPMLRPDLLKENIDGEAIEWAVERLSKISAQRRILIVLSDGAPVDDSTLHSNDKDILDRHLREVIGHIEAAGEIKLLGIGIGFDTGQYYRDSRALRSPDDLGTVLISALEDVICAGQDETRVAAIPEAMTTLPEDEREPRT